MIFKFTEKRNDIEKADKEKFAFYIKSYMDGHYYYNNICKKYSKNNPFRRIVLKELQSKLHITDADWRVIKLYTRKQRGVEIIDVLHDYWYNNVDIKDGKLVRNEGKIVEYKKDDEE